MDVQGRNNNKNNNVVMSSEDDEMDLRRGPWTVDEDLTLMNYIATHGEGRWNTLANLAGTNSYQIWILNLLFSLCDHKYDDSEM